MPIPARRFGRPLTNPSAKTGRLSSAEADEHGDRAEPEPKLLDAQANSSERDQHTEPPHS